LELLDAELLDAAGARAGTAINDAIASATAAFLKAERFMFLLP